MATTTREQIPPGTLDLLILRVLERHQPSHGFEIAEAIRRLSENVLQVEEGSLYPALQRMLLKGWIKGDWAKTADNRRARYYQLTRSGQAHLQQEQARYQRVSAAIAGVLEPV
jgi:transcriptional regulator